MEYIRAVIYLVYAVLAALVGVVIGMLVCIGQPGVEYVVAGVQVHRTHPVGLPVRLRAFTAPAGGDPAKPIYFCGPARSDLRYVRQVAHGRWRRAVERWQERIFKLIEPLGDRVILTAPVGAGLAVGLIVALPLGALPAAVVLLAHEIVVDIAAVGMWSAAATLRAVDSALLSIRHIKLRCVACFRRMPYPAYLCPECKNIHRDIRPGRYGVLHRYCECGRQMPTGLLFGAARKLDAICPYPDCEHPHEHRPGEAQEIILPVFGSKGAGKTLLLCGILITLRQSSRPGVHVAAADSFTRERLDDLESALTQFREVPATPVIRPRAYVLRLRIGSQRRIVQFLDTAGELFYDSQRSADLIYLGAANTFVLVIDPLSVNAFWNSLPSAARKRFTPYRSNAPHPELAFQQTADRIAEMGKPRAKHRLAIVFSRADLLAKEHGPEADDSAEIRRWAIDDLGLTGLVHQAESEFKEIVFFHTAAFDGNETNLNALIHWLMRAEGIDPEASGPRADPELSSAK